MMASKSLIDEKNKFVLQLSSLTMQSYIYFEIHLFLFLIFFFKKKSVILHFHKKLLVPFVVFWLRFLYFCISFWLKLNNSWIEWTCLNSLEFWQDLVVKLVGNETVLMTLQPPGYLFYTNVSIYQILFKFYR